jgi:hypothetical protein
MEEKKTSPQKRKTEVEKEETGRKEKEGRKEERKKRRLSSRGNSRDSTPVKRSKLSSLGSSSSPGETSIFYITFPEMHVTSRTYLNNFCHFSKIKDIPNYGNLTVVPVLK